MKKYNVFDLFVVEDQIDNKINYFICKYNVLNETYTEIFTNEKIIVTDNSIVKPLANYYSILARCNYTTGKHLMLDKKDLLIKLININIEASLEKDELFSHSIKNNVEENDIIGQLRVLKK